MNTLKHGIRQQRVNDHFDISMGNLVAEKQQL